MHGAGCGEGEAATIARRLVDSNLVGHDSHGVLRVPRYLEWIKDGTLRPNTAPTLVFDSETIAIVDGNRSFGQVTGEFATKLGIAKASTKGIAMIGCAIAGTSGASAIGRTWRRRRARFRCTFSIRRARSAWRPSVAATAGSRPIRSRSACPSPTPIRSCST
jgi:LDH2 family malate/lactate/ureidoglycolate dehydrogenase